MMLIETGLLLMALVIALLCPELGHDRFGKLERVFVGFAERRMLSAITIGLLAVLARLAVLPVLPVPYPGIPDEFGHLLAADTFAHFRLANPTHPMWMHFENLSEIQRPTYVSKYPPAQGIILAIGQLLFGHPFWGVCLSIGLMCAGICWMLQAWLPSVWALLGGVLAIIRLGTFSYWANSYWGGAIAALGGALVLGALPRIKTAQRARYAAILAVGLAMLANSRPYEGLILSLPVAFSLAVWLFRLNFHQRSRALSRLILPLSACLAVAALLTAYYCLRTTGNPWQTPYQVAQETYYPTPLFLWQQLRPTLPTQHPDIQNDLENWEIPVYQAGRQHPILMAEARIFFFAWFFFGPALIFPFLVLPYVLPTDFSWKHLHPDTRLLLIILVTSLLAAMFPLFFNPGYSAPLTAAVYALVLKALLRVRSWTIGQKAIGIAFSRCFVIACVALVFVRIAARPLRLELHGARTWASLEFQLLDRKRLENELSHAGGRQLVIVRYTKAGPAQGTEWVANAADIDHSDIVWARDMGPERNAELLNYFSDRRAWMLEPNWISPTLHPYSADINPASPNHLFGRNNQLEP